MTWATDRRLDYIDWRVATRGAINRVDLVRVFDVSINQASVDLNEYIRLYPDALAYDRVAKCYVPARAITAHRPYRRHRNGAWPRAINWALTGAEAHE